MSLGDLFCSLLSAFIWQIRMRSEFPVNEQMEPLLEEKPKSLFQPQGCLIGRPHHLPISAAPSLLPFWLPYHPLNAPLMLPHHHLPSGGSVHLDVALTAHTTLLGSFPPVSCARPISPAMVLSSTPYHLPSVPLVGPSPRRI